MYKNKYSAETVKNLDTLQKIVSMLNPYVANAHENTKPKTAKAAINNVQYDMGQHEAYNRVCPMIKIHKTKQATKTCHSRQYTTKNMSNYHTNR